MVSRLDRDVGQIVALLKELKLDEQTLVIFTSDNGATNAGGANLDFLTVMGLIAG